MESQREPKRCTPAVLLTVLAAFILAVWIFWPNPLDGKLLVRLPVPRDAEVRIQSGPPESDRVCVTALFSGYRSFAVSVRTRRWRLMPNTYGPNNFRGLPLAKSGAILLIDSETGQLRTVSWSGKPLRRYPQTASGASYKMLVGSTFLLCDRRQYFGYERCRILDLRTEKMTTLPIPMGRAVDSICRGNAQLPAILHVITTDSQGVHHRQIWLADAKGSIVRQLKIPKHGRDTSFKSALDDIGNIYLSEMQHLWVYPPEALNRREVWRLSKRQSVVSVRGARQGAYICMRDPSNLQRALEWVLFSNASNRFRSVHGMTWQMWRRLTVLRDVWYASPSGRQRKHVARNVRSFMISSDYRRLYFTRGNEVRMVVLPTEAE